MMKVKDFIGIEHRDYEIYRSEKAPQTPLVSVLLPTYCRGDNGLLRRAAQSVLQQSFRDLELIIIDDGSVDLTREIIRRLQQTDDRVIHIRNHRNSGLPAIKVMQGFMHSKGRYITYQFDDDQWKPKALAHMVDALRSESVNTFAFGACEYIKKVEGKTLILGDKDLTPDDVFHSNTIPNNTVIHPRELYDRYGAYDPHLLMRRLTDWDLWIRWTASGVKLKRIPQVLSIVEEQRDGSLFSTVETDVILMRRIQSARNLNKRNAALCTAQYLDYEIDDIRWIADDFKRQELYKNRLMPFYEKNTTRIQKSTQEKMSQKQLKPCLLVTKDYYQAAKDHRTRGLLTEENPYFTTCYMPTEHLSLDPNVMEMVDGSIVIQKNRKMTGVEEQLLQAKPRIDIGEGKYTSELPETIDRTLREQWAEQQQNTVLQEPQPRQTLSDEQLERHIKEQLTLEEQQLTIRKLEKQLQDMMGFGEPISEISAEHPYPATDLRERVLDHNRWMLSKKTKLLRHLTGENYRQSERYISLIRQYRQEKYLAQKQYVEFSPYLTEDLELRYRLEERESDPHSTHIALYTTNHNPTTLAIIASISVTDADHRPLIQKSLRGTEIRHHQITKIPLPSGAIRYPLTLCIKGQNQVASCAVSVLEWKKRNLIGKTVCHHPFIGSSKIEDEDGQIIS